MSGYDVIVVGGGHNGLVCAFYLARAGLRVAVVEQRDVLGGPCATVEAVPGYRLSFTNSPGSLEPRIAEDMDLSGHGLRFTRPDPSMVHLLDPDEAFVAWRDRNKVRDLLATFDRREPDAYAALMDYIEWFAGRLALSLYEPPPRLADLLAKLSTPEDELGYGRFFLGSVADLLDTFLHTRQMKAVVGTLAMMSSSAGPLTPGTAQMLLWRPLSKLSGQVGGLDDPRNNELRGSTGLPIGGMGAVTDAMADAARAAGVDILTQEQVTAIRVDRDGRVRGIATATGRELDARVVASNLHPARTLRDLVPVGAVPDPVLAGLPQARGNQFKLALAVNGIPRLRVAHRLADAADTAACQFRIAPSLEYLERAWDDAKYGDWSHGPVFWGLTPSVADPTLAPPGHHVMSVNIYHAPIQLRDGRSWATEKDRFAQRCLAVLDDYYEDLTGRLVGYRAWSPEEIEQEFGMLGGNVTYGDMLPGNSLSLRPSPYLSDYRTPVAGLYLCGAAMHPGGYVTGLPGHNAATAIVADLRR